MGRCSYNDAAVTRTYSYFAGFTQVHGERAICCTISCERENSPQKEEQRLSRVIQSWCIFYFRRCWTGMFHTIQECPAQGTYNWHRSGLLWSSTTPLHSVENYQNSQNSEINVNLPSTPSTQSQIQNFGFVQASSVLGQNSQQNHPWGLTVNSQQGSNRGLTAEQMDSLNNNPPLLCFLYGTMVRCQGCRTKFTENMRIPPNDLLVKMLVVKPRLIKGKWVPGWQKSWGYFHLNINCLQRHLSFVEVEDI